MDQETTTGSTSKRYCSVPQCSTYYHSDSNISFHYFPLKEKALCDKWKNNLKIGKAVTQYMNVCSKHFLKEDFMPVTNETQRKRLKRGVVPSQNLPTGSHDKKKPIKERSKRLKQDESATIQNCLEVKCGLVQTSASSLSTATVPTIPEFRLKDSPVELVEVGFNQKGYVKQYVDKSTQTDFDNDYGFTNVLLGDDDKLKAFTNTDFQTLDTLIDCCNEVLETSNENFLHLQEKVMLVLIKLKLNIPFLCLAILFNISSATCVRYFYSTLGLLAVAIKPAIYWPSKGQILSNMPKCFQGFMNTRVVLDCTEIGVDKCRCLKCRILTYSHYKGRHTLKFLVGVTPSGLISYVSKAHGGRASDKAIFNKEKLIDKLDPQDAIMVDKGFLVDKECEDKLITLIRPPFLKKNKQFSKGDAEKTAAIARARIHVERAIQRIKTYSIVHDQVAWYLVPHIDDVMTVVAALVNLSPPILSDDKFIHEIIDEIGSSRTML